MDAIHALRKIHLQRCRQPYYIMKSGQKSSSLKKYHCQEETFILLLLETLFEQWQTYEQCLSTQLSHPISVIIGKTHRILYWLVQKCQKEEDILCICVLCGYKGAQKMQLKYHCYEASMVATERLQFSLTLFSYWLRKTICKISVFFSFCHFKNSSTLPSESLQQVIWTTYSSWNESARLSQSVSQSVSQTSPERHRYTGSDIILFVHANQNPPCVRF